MRALFAMLLLLGCGSAAAVTCNSASTGTWFAVARWSCGHIPLAADDVVILNTHTVDVDTANGVAQSVTVNNGGTLRFNSTTARTLTVSRAGSGTGTGNVTVSTTGTFTINNVTQSGHILRLDGNLTNNGTFNMAIDGNSRAIVEFNRNGAQSLTGTGATTNFQQIRLNMTSANNILDVTALSNLTFTNGLAPNVSTTSAGSFRISSPLTLSNLVNNSLPANLRIWVNDAGATLNNPANMSILANGTLQVDAGTFSASGTLAIAGLAQVNGGAATVTGNVTVTGTLQATGGTLTMNGATGITVTGGIFRIDGGAVTVGNASDERVILTSNAATTFLMNGGTLDVAGRITNSAAAGLGSFTLNNGTITAGISGNTLNSALGAPFFIASGMTYTLAGGIIIIQSSNTQAGAREYDVNSTVGNSTVTGGTVQIGNAATAAGQTFQIDSVPPVPDFTINATNNPGVTLLAALTVNGNWTNNSSGTFTPGGFTVAFGGGAAQTIGGSVATAFAGMTINNASGVSLSSIDASASGVLTFSAGNFSTGSNTLTMTAAAPAIVGATTARHVVGNLAKVFPAAAGTSYIFTVGDGTNYSPLTITFPAAPTSGNLTVSVTNEDHRNTTAGTSGINSLLGVNRYWTVKDSTVAGTYDATFAYVAGDNDGGTTPASYRIRRGAGCSGTGVSRTCTPWAALTVSGTPTTTGAVATGVVVAADDPAQADFAIGQLDPSINFLREKQFIYTRELY